MFLTDLPSNPRAPRLYGAVLFAVAFTAPLAAAQEPVPPPEPSAPALDPRVDALAEEVRRLKLEVAAPESEYRSHAGMGPAASKVYFSPRGLAIGGYGEINYENFIDQPGRKDRTDLLRAVLYTGYKFSDRIVFNSELEFEHGHTGKKGAVEVEFAYLDFILSPYAAIRAGNVLVPIGFLNEMHEPPFFHGVLRPDVERNLIPTTWNENAVGLYGHAGWLRYKAYLMNGLQAFSDQKCVTDTKGTPDKADDVSVCDRGNRGFTAGSWIREGRARGSEAFAETFAGVLNLTAQPWAPLLLGATVYYGYAGQGTKLDGATIEAPVLLAEGHAGLTWKGLELRALFAVGTLNDEGVVSLKQGQTVASRVMGGYGEVAYDVLGRFLPDWGQSLSPFVRGEFLELHDEVPAGLAANPALSSVTVTAGLSYRPIPNVVAKVDFQHRRSEAMTGAKLDQVNVGLGFAF